MTDRGTDMSASKKALLIVAVGAIAVSAAGAQNDDAELKPLIRSVTNWWVLDDGKTLLVEVDGSLKRIDPKTGKGKSLMRPTVRLTDVVRLSATKLGCGVVDDSMHVLDTASGKSAGTSIPPGQYQVLGRKKGRDWCVIVALSTPASDRGTVVSVLNLKTNAVRELTGSMENPPTVTIPEDGKQVIVWATHQLQKLTFKIPAGIPDPALKATGQHQALYPLPAGDGYVLQKKDKLYLAREGKEAELFEGKYRAWALPDVPLSPRRLAIQRLADTNKDGKISKKGGDLAEIWLLDLTTLKKQLLVDAKQENIMRGWSADGQVLAFKRWEPILDRPGKSVSALVLYDAARKKSHYVLPARGSISVRHLGVLPGGWALAQEVDLFGKGKLKDQAFLFGFRHDQRRVPVSKPKKRAAVVGEWLFTSDPAKPGRPCHLYRRKLPKE